MPAYVMMEILEYPCLSLSDLRRLYISFEGVRKALCARSSIVRTKIQKYIDESLQLMRVCSKERLPPPKWFWPKIKALEGELQALHFFIKSGLGRYPAKGMDELTDVQKQNVVETLLAIEPRFDTYLRDYLIVSKKRMGDRLCLFTCALLSALAQNAHLTLKAHPLYAEMNSPIAALSFKLACHLKDRVNLMRYDEVQRPLFYYLYYEGADKLLQMSAAQYFALVFSDINTWKSFITLADQMAGIDDHMTKALLELVPGNDETMMLLESMGKIAQKMVDMNLQNEVVQIMNRMMDLDEYQQRQERRNSIK